MRNIRPEDRDDEIRRLLDAEIEDATARFRAGDFEARVREKIGAAPASKRRRPFARLFPLPLRLAVAAGLAVAGLVVVFRPAKTPRQDIVGTIEKVLGQSPVLRAIQDASSWRARISTDIPRANDPTILNVLEAYRKIDSEGERSAPAAAVIAPPARPLTLEDMYKILVVDKSVERVLKLLLS